MSVNILLGVGGTGAKIVEAILHMVEAGLGPNSLLVGFVDQDDGNGNLVRARALLSDLQDVRRAWGPGGSHGLDGAATRLLRSDVRPLVAGGRELWTPDATPNARLSTIFGGMDPDDRLVFDCLFARGDLEQDMPLDRGYRGRPAIGSTAMAALAPRKPDANEPFWAALMEQLRHAQHGEDVRLVLAGSVFGGTGAAGFPTLARLLRRRLADDGIRANISLSGVLMAPYFSFAPPPNEEGVAANVARAEHLLIQSRGALNYYHHMFAEEQIFDEMLLFGWNHPFQLGYHKDGAGEQLNPAMSPELLAALSVCGLFRAPQPPNAAPGHRPNRVRVIARERDERLAWTDLPSPVAEADAPYRAIGRLLRFSVAWRYFGSLFNGGNAVKRRHGGTDWFRRLRLHQIDYNAEPTDAQISAMNAYLNRFIVWCGEIQAYGNRGAEFALWRVNRMMMGPPAFDRPWALLTPRAELGGSEWATAFDEAVVAIPGRTLPSANDLFQRLSRETVAGAHSGVGRLIAALYDYSGVAQ